jgi:hypothetical protein
MTAAEMRTHLIEKRAKEAARLKAWALEKLPPMLGILMEGVRADSRCCDSQDEAEAIVALARSLGYTARVDLDDDLGEDYYAVVEAPEATS